MAEAGIAPSPAATAERRPQLAGHRFANAHVTLAPAPPAARLSVRGDRAAAGEALGLDLPERVGRSTVHEGRTALALGPDEWLVIDETTDAPPPVTGDERHVGVDVSHRNVAFLVSGPGAVATLNAGCPRDLAPEAFPVGAAARTVLGKAEIVLLRTGDDAFRVECWRSFAPYVWALLEDAGGDAGL